jgi:hypothetical protein
MEQRLVSTRIKFLLAEFDAQFKDLRDSEKFKKADVLDASLMAEALQAVFFDIRKEMELMKEKNNNNELLGEIADGLSEMRNKIMKITTGLSAKAKGFSFLQQDTIPGYVSIYKPEEREGMRKTLIDSINLSGEIMASSFLTGMAGVEQMMREQRGQQDCTIQ